MGTVYMHCTTLDQVTQLNWYCYEGARPFGENGQTQWGQVGDLTDRLKFKIPKYGLDLTPLPTVTL